MASIHSSQIADRSGLDAGIDDKGASQGALDGLGVSGNVLRLEDGSRS